MAWEPRGAQKRISFGSCQERKIFPAHQASDRLGIQLTATGGNPALGPGCYLSQEQSSLRYSLGNRPLSNKGYVIGARTAQRFMPQPQPVSPSPATHQPFGNKRCQPAYAPFSAKTPRFPDKPSDKELIPGSTALVFDLAGRPEYHNMLLLHGSRPGTYEAEKQLHKKLTWPMKFGSPDWSLVPMPATRMLKTEVQKLSLDREWRRRRDRAAYLSLFFS